MESNDLCDLLLLLLDDDLFFVEEMEQEDVDSIQ